MEKTVFHKNLGECVIDAQCLAMQATNPDRTSIFVKHDGEIKEVTKSMVSDQKGGAK